MGNNFMGLNIAKSGLYTSRKALELIGHNIANADTKGYTRQRLVMQSISPFSYDARYVPVKGSVIGSGVEIQILDQIRDAYLDIEYRSENAALGKWDTRANELEYIESLVNETSDSSISRAMADFFNSLHELSVDPVSKVVRTSVQQNGLKLTDTINHYYNKFSDLQQAYDDSMVSITVNVNDLTNNIAEFNKQIFSYEMTGGKANDMRDKRNLALDELSKLVNITYVENSDNQLVVSVEGVEIVNHLVVTKLEASPVLTGVVSSTTGFHEIYYEGTVIPFAYSSGTLEAYRNLRDGNAVDDMGVPRILDELNILARSLAEEFNTVNNAGYTVPYGTNPSQTGVDFFIVPGGLYANVTAGNLSLSSEILDDVYNIAASDQLIDLSAPNNQLGNNNNALDFVTLSSRTNVPIVSNFEDYLKSIVVSIALESAHSYKLNDSQHAIVNNIENRKLSISGVSVDEEMVEMVKFQHAYAASARLINAVDEMLDILINRTGLVGR